MATLSKQELQLHLNFVVARTARGKAVIQHDPRDLPRRLRLLLLSIDGSRPVRLYMQTLKGFGDVGDLLIELLALGLVHLQPPTPSKFMPPPVSAHGELDSLLDDSRFNFRKAEEMLYGKTSAGSFDEMMRVAQLENPEFKPPPAPPPAPVSQSVQQTQIESLFELLDAVRGERRSLKFKLEKMKRLRQALAREQKTNQRLWTAMLMLAGLCLVLFCALAFVLTRH